MSRQWTGILVLTLGIATAAYGQATDKSGLHAHDHATSTAAVPPDVSVPQTEGEVRKVDAAAQKLTVKHGRIENLGMSPMTMVFRVKDPAFLQDDRGACGWHADHRGAAARPLSSEVRRARRSAATTRPTRALGEQFGIARRVRTVATPGGPVAAWAI